MKVIAIAICLCAAIAGQELPAFAGTGYVAPPPPTTTTGSSQSGGGYQVWRAATREAFFSQGSSCPWRYVGKYYAPGTDIAMVEDKVTPVGTTLVFATCNGEPRIVLTPEPGEVAGYLWEQVRGSVPVPEIRFGPVPNGAAIVNVDTWYWIDGASQRVEFTGGLLGTAATITVVPSTITTDWADGNVTTCQAPGIDYHSVGHPTAAHIPDPAPTGGCSYRYRRHSGQQPDKRYPITHTVEWNATWRTNDGLGGTFEPVTNQTVTPLKVIQIQAVGTTNP